MHSEAIELPFNTLYISGHCGQNFCDQTCIDIDNGGFACECYDGYQLNRNGFTCSSKYKSNCKRVIFILEEHEVAGFMSVLCMQILMPQVLHNSTG